MREVIDASKRFGGGAYDPRSADGKTHEDYTLECTEADSAIGEALRALAEVGRSSFIGHQDRIHLQEKLREYGILSMLAAAERRAGFEVVD